MNNNLIDNKDTKDGDVFVIGGKKIKKKTAFIVGAAVLATTVLSIIAIACRKKLPATSPYAVQKSGSKNNVPTLESDIGAGDKLPSGVEKQMNPDKINEDQVHEVISVDKTANADEGNKTNATKTDSTDKTANAGEPHMDNAQKIKLVLTELNKTISSAQKSLNEAHILADKANKQSDEVMAEFKNKADNVIALFENQVLDKNGKKAVAIDEKFIDDDKITPKIMTEIFKDGTRRESEFVDGVLEKITETASDAKKKLYYLFDNKLCKYEEGCETLANGDTKTAFRLKFNASGKPCEYKEGCETLANGDTKLDRKLIVNPDGKIACYVEDFEVLANGDFKVAKALESVVNMLYYKEGCEELANNDTKIAKKLIFQDNKPQRYEEGYSLSFPGKNNIIEELKLELELVDGQWKECSTKE